jgi:site-specific recombinase XerD
MKIIASYSDQEKLLEEFRQHLLKTKGLAPRTCAARIFYVRSFIEQRRRMKQRKLVFQELAPEDLLNYILERSAQDSPGRLQALASALRSFVRFLQFSRRSTQSLAASLPRIASRGRSSLPDYLSAEQLEVLLGSIDTATARGQRNYAIVLCLARLGLRAAEVAALTLEQIQWRAGVIRLGAGKGRRERQLPLPQDAGRAITNYLRQRKCPGNTREVFCAVNTGKGLCSRAISQVVRRALQRAGIQTPRPGAHLLRRTLASHLVQGGVSLKAVADLLGHRSLDTTRLYASVDHAMLREVSRPWPKEFTR